MKPKDRIQIDGHWYVLENTNSLDLIEVTEFVGTVYESKLYCFEATKILRENGTMYDSINIKIINKQTSKEDVCDNENFFRGVLEKNEESLTSTKEFLCDIGIVQFTSFLNLLVEKKWIIL